ncbi:hypothetical protein EON67_12025, partial [archaeon]
MRLCVCLPVCVRAEAAGRVKTRLTKESGDRIAAGGGKIGGVFKVTPEPTWLKDRVGVYEEI